MENTVTKKTDLIRPISDKKPAVRYCECGKIIDSGRGRRLCEECLAQNIIESKLRYEKKRRLASMSEPKRASITRNKSLQIVIRNMEHTCASENHISSLSSFNRWANGAGKKIYTDYARRCIIAFIRQYLSVDNGDPMERMNNITRSVPEIRMAYISERIRRQNEMHFKTFSDYQDYERNNMREAGEWRADLVCDLVKDNIYLLNTVDFSDVGRLLGGNSNWR